MKNESEEPLISIHPKSDFENLLWERNRSKELLILYKSALVTIGELKSDIDELKDLINQGTGSKTNRSRHIMELQNKLKERNTQHEKIKELYHKTLAENGRLVEKIANLNLELKKHGTDKES